MTNELFRQNIQEFKEKRGRSGVRVSAIRAGGKHRANVKKVREGSKGGAGEMSRLLWRKLRHRWLK